MPASFGSFLTGTKKYITHLKIPTQANTTRIAAACSFFLQLLPENKNNSTNFVELTSTVSAAEGDSISTTTVAQAETEVKQFSDRKFPSNAEDVAKAYFGTTKKWSETGWLLRDGSQIDFSGRHWERDSENEIDLRI